MKCTCGAELIPYELKTTYMSSNRPIEGSTAWVRQIMAECYVTGSTVAYLTRFCIMGNWKIAEGNRPTLQAYRLEFTQDELERNWQWFLERKEDFLRIIESGELLPRAVALPRGEDYECKYCHYDEKECKG